MNTSISIVGAGSWGTALACLLSSKGHSVRLICHRKEHADLISKTRENSQYLPGEQLPKSIQISCSPKDITGSSLVVFAVPSAFLRQTAKQYAPFIGQAIILHAVKGLEEHSGKLMSQILREELGRDACVLSGPNHAEEVAQKKPTATVIGSKDKETSRKLCRIFSTDTFKAYPHDDVIGVEICGAMKNIVAIAIGVCDGLSMGDNTKASIVTLGLSEMSTIVKHFGGKRTTCFGLAGVGDLVATCYSSHSRNRFVGEQLALGKLITQINKEMHGMVAEGVRNTKSIYEACHAKKIRTVLIEQTYNVLYKNTDLKKSISELLRSV